MQRDIFVWIALLLKVYAKTRARVQGVWCLKAEVKRVRWERKKNGCRNELGLRCGHLRALSLSGPSGQQAKNTQDLPHTRRGGPAVCSSVLVEGYPFCAPRRFLFLGSKKQSRETPGCRLGREEVQGTGHHGWDLQAEEMWQEASQTHWPWKWPHMWNFSDVHSLLS